MPSVMSTLRRKKLNMDKAERLNFMNQILADTASSISADDKLEMYDAATVLMDFADKIFAPSGGMYLNLHIDDVPGRLGGGCSNSGSDASSIVCECGCDNDSHAPAIAAWPVVFPESYSRTKVYDPTLEATEVITTGSKHHPSPPFRRAGFRSKLLGLSKVSAQGGSRLALRDSLEYMEVEPSHFMISDAFKQSNLVPSPQDIAFDGYTMIKVNGNANEDNEVDADCDDDHIFVKAEELESHVDKLVKKEEDVDKEEDFVGLGFNYVDIKGELLERAEV